MMKKLLILGLLLVLTISSLAWGGPVTINVIGMQQAAMTVEEMNQVAKEFEAKNPDIKVNLTFVGYDALHDKIATAMAGGVAAYDAILVDDIWYAEFAEAGWLWDVTSKI
ncbi:MAG TPA: extracellular solute-binding protein, partial [Candidatus Atribacteria bacterium]|nr:extracellular solute-binding protein [Candidatus Atribacteria bacterium]